jgi:hypothetical protein
VALGVVDPSSLDESPPMHSRLKGFALTKIDMDFVPLVARTANDNVVPKLPSVQLA